MRGPGSQPSSLLGLRSGPTANSSRNRKGPYSKCSYKTGFTEQSQTRDALKRSFRRKDPIALLLLLSVWASTVQSGRQRSPVISKPQNGPAHCQREKRVAPESSGVYTTLSTDVSSARLSNSLSVSFSHRAEVKPTVCLAAWFYTPEFKG